MQIGKLNPTYKIKNPNQYNLWQHLIVKILLQAYRDLLGKEKRSAIIFFSDDWCDVLCAGVYKDGDKAYQQAKGVLSGEISLKNSDYE